MPDIPFHTAKIEPIDRHMRKLIADAGRVPTTPPTRGDDLVEFARRVVAGRKQRDRYFDPMLFSNPAWDILLNLFVAGAEGRQVTVLDSCSAAPVPQGVALRWLGYLKQEEMVIETSDPIQARQTLIRLSDQTRLVIASYLTSLSSLGLGPAFP